MYDCVFIMYTCMKWTKVHDSLNESILTPKSKNVPIERRQYMEKKACTKKWGFYLRIW